MAEYRPYRVANRAANARLTQVKLISVAGFATTALFINWWVTQHAARLFGYAHALGPTLPGGLYAPWEWIVWWIRWHGAQQLQPVWNLCAREAALPLLVDAALATGAINIARWWLRDTTPDLHGSARWANAQEVRTSGFLAPSRYLPRPVRRRLVRAGLLEALKPRDGVYLGAWRVHGKLHYLRDCGLGHVLVEAPTRAGKGVNNMVPTLLTWPHSTLVHDFKGELWEVTAGARKRMGQLCLNFDPAHVREGGVKFNPLEEVRLRTRREIADAQNLVQILVDPDGRGFASGSHWVAAGSALLTGAILHLLYVEPNKTLRGLIGLLTDPASTIEETLQGMMTADHDPAGVMGWRTSRGEPTRTHQVVAESMRAVLNTAEKERSGIISEIVTRLPLFRDPLIAEATEYSEFRIDDLVNHKRPASLYLTVPRESCDRLRPLMRLMLNQIVRRLTEKLAYKDGRPVSPHRRPLLLMLDEFALFGRFEEFAESMNHIAGFGLRACLAVQSLSQLHEFYGPNQSIVDNCDTTVRFTPNSLKSAEEISRLVGQTSVRHAHRTQSGGGASVSEPEVGRPLMTPDEARRMSVNEVLIFARGQRPIRARLLKYHEAPYFRRLAAIKPPVTSDRTITASPVTDERKKVERATSIYAAGAAAHKEPPQNEAAPNGNGAGDANRDGGNRKLRFLKLATDGPEPKPAAHE
jgi:type IV secretion system protein VirD4